MAGIVGIARQGNSAHVKIMLDKIAYRGNSIKIIETESTTLGVSVPHDGQRLKAYHNLRRLPEVKDPQKSKSRQGAGVQDLLARYAQEKITDSDFSPERQLPNF